MSSFSVDGSLHFVPDARNPRLHWLNEFKRNCSLLEHIPIFAVDSALLSSLNLQSVSGLGFLQDDSNENVGNLTFALYDEGGVGGLLPQTFETKKAAIEFTLATKSVRTLGDVYLQNMLETAGREVKNLCRASLIYGGESSWPSWPYQESDADVYAVENAPRGLSVLSNQAMTGHTIDTLGAALSLDTLDYQGFLQGQIPPNRATYILMNSDMLYAYTKLWHDELRGEEVKMVKDPLSGNMLPSHCGVPILTTNFIASCDGTAPNVDNPEYMAGEKTSSIYIVHIDYEKPRNGLCILYPKDYGESFIKLERCQNKDSTDRIAFRFSMEYVLFVPTTRDIVRLRNIEIPYATVM